MLCFDLSVGHDTDTLAIRFPPSLQSLFVQVEDVPEMVATDDSFLERTCSSVTNLVVTVVATHGESEIGSVEDAVSWLLKNTLSLARLGLVSISIVWPMTELMAGLDAWKDLVNTVKVKCVRLKMELVSDKTRKPVNGSLQERFQHALGLLCL